MGFAANEAGSIISCGTNDICKAILGTTRSGHRREFGRSPHSVGIDLNPIAEERAVQARPVRVELTHGYGLGHIRIRKRFPCSPGLPREQEASGSNSATASVEIFRHLQF